MTFCRCHQRTDFPDPPPELDHLDLLSASKYLKKVALAVSDVRMKLNVNRIIHFLASITSNQMKFSLINAVEREQAKNGSMPETADKQHSQNKQNFIGLNEPDSFMCIQTSKSFVSDLQFNEGQCFGAVSNNSPSTLSKAFKFKQVVTKNSLEEQHSNLHHVRFVSSIRSEAQDEEQHQIIEKLQEQNRHLEECLKNIFNFFEEKNLISFEGSVNDFSKLQYRDAAEQLTCNFIDYTNQIQQRIANLSAKQSLLQETIHNMSISMRIDKDPKEETPHKAVQTDQLQEITLIHDLQEQLNQAHQTARKGEIMLYLKDEEIESLRVIISGLQNKMKSSRVEDKPRSKSYKKFFEVTGEDLSKSVR